MELISNTESPDSLVRAVRRDIQKLLEFSLCLEISLVIMLSAFYLDFPYEMALFPLILYNVRNIVSVFVHTPRSSNIWGELKHNDRLFYIFVYCSDMLAKVAGFLHVALGTPSVFIFVFALMPGIMGPMYRREYSTKLRRLIEFIHSSLRVCMVMDLLFFTISESFELDWDWHLILFPTLTYFSIAAFLSLSLFVCYFIYNMIICNWSECRSKLSDIVIIFTLLLYSGAFQVINSNLPYMLETSDYRRLLVPACALGLATLIFFVNFTCFRQNLLNSIDSRVSISNSESPPSPQEQSKKTILKRLPKLFARISTVFYKPIQRKEFVERVIMNSSSVCGREEPKEKIQRAHSQENSVDFSQIIVDDDDSECNICCSKKSSAVFFACGHGGVCYECAIEVKSKKNMCHICRAPIEDVIKVEQNQHVAYSHK